MGDRASETLKTELRRMRVALEEVERSLSALRTRGTSEVSLDVLRLLKQEAALKDRIAILEDRVTPDIIA